MSDAPNFANLLNTPMDSIEEPSPWPPGTYYGICTGYKLGVANWDKTTPIVTIEVHLHEAGSDVDQDDLARAKVDFNQRQRWQSQDYQVSSGGLLALRRLMQATGLNIEGRTATELLPELQGQNIMAEVVIRPDKKDPTRQYNNITRLGGKRD